MNKDVLPAAENETGDGVIAWVIRSKSLVYTLFLGATLGMLMAILNLAAVDDQWKFPQEYFDRIDAPLYSLIVSRYDPSGLPLKSTDVVTNSCPVRVALACYWVAMGLVLASVVYSLNRRDP